MIARAEIEVRYPDGTVERIEYAGCPGFLEEWLHLCEMYCAATANPGNPDSPKVRRETLPRLRRPLDHILRLLAGHPDKDKWRAAKELSANFEKTPAWAVILIQSGLDKGFIRRKKVLDSRSHKWEVQCQITDEGLKYIQMVEKSRNGDRGVDHGK